MNFYSNTLARSSAFAAAINAPSLLPPNGDGAIKKEHDMNKVANIGHNNPPEGIEAVIECLKAGRDATEALDALAETQKTPVDLSTDKSRKEIASRAYAISKMKTEAEEVGKQLVSGWKQKAKVVDASRATIRTRLDEIRDTIRKPLTDWENAEEERKQSLRTRLADLGFDYVNSQTSLKEVSAAIELIEATVIDETWGDYIHEAQIEKDATIKTLNGFYLAAKQREADQAELQKLRAEREERERQDEKKRIEQKRIADAEAEAKRKADHEAAIETARKEAAKKAEQDALDAAAEEAETARLEAKQREAELQQQVEDERRRTAEAVAAERTRVEQQQQDEAEAQRKLEADEQHKNQVEDLIYSAIFKITGNQSHSHKIVTALMTNLIPHMELKL